MKLIVGLGNPELKYAMTRHNMGFLAIDCLLDKIGDLKLNDTKFNGIYTKTKYNNNDIIIAKPLTYMNNSGDFIRPLADYYKIDYNDIIVVYDELALNVGRIKITKEGSAAGHNGIKSIINNLNTEKFIKVRIGIGPVPDYIKQIDYVLMKMTVEDFKDYKKILDKAAEEILFILDNDIDKAMNKYN